MTDQDKNRAIAEELEYHGLVGLAYDADAVACSKGHGFSADVPFAPRVRVGARCLYNRICDGIIEPVPHDFTDPRYLYPALEDWCVESQMLFRCFPSDDGMVWFARIHHAHHIGEVFDGDGPTLGVALRNALVAALEAEK